MSTLMCMTLVALLHSCIGMELLVSMGPGNITWINDQCICAAGNDEHGLEGTLKVGVQTRNVAIHFNGCGGYPSIGQNEYAFQLESWPTVHQLNVDLTIYMPTCSNVGLEEHFLNKIIINGVTEINTLYEEFIGADLQSKSELTGSWLSVYFEARCPPDQYGSSCERRCDAPAPGYSNGRFYTCNADTGERHCLSFFYGVNCDVYCKPDTLRYSCSSTGSKDCHNGYYGDQCTVQCIATSDDQFTCDTETGYKICKAGWYGIDCTTNGSVYQTAFFITLALLIAFITLAVITIVFMCCLRCVAKQAKTSSTIRLTEPDIEVQQELNLPIAAIGYSKAQGNLAFNLAHSTQLVQAYKSIESEKLDYASIGHGTSGHLYSIIPDPKVSYASVYHENPAG